MRSDVTIVIPVHNGALHLSDCLNAVRALDPAPLECLVVDDGSTDGSGAIAEQAGFTVLSTGMRRGPAAARNIGARAARGTILLFIDADVRIPSGTVGRMLARFAEDAARDAVIGSYDDQPANPAFVSQYRNLLHCYTHQNSNSDTCTFWTGCGAIRASVFSTQGGFSEAYRRPQTEDMELGLRLRQSGRHVWLDKTLQVKHLKRFTFLNSLRTDVLDRAIPWTLLILRFRFMPADLNLKWTQRFSVALASASFGALLAALALALTGIEPAAWSSLAAAISAVAVLAALNRGFYQFLAARRGTWFALRSFPLHWLYFCSSAAGFAAGVACHLLEVAAPGPARETASSQSDS